MSHDADDERLRQAVRNALAPADPAGPSRDLWPELRRRIERRPAPVSRLDWALLAALLAFFVIFPEALVTLLYHL
jgi:hypothetical protein